jgi:hypothetical protein
VTPILGSATPGAVSTEDKLDIVVSKFVDELTAIIKEAAKEQVLAALASSGFAAPAPVRGGRGRKAAAAAPVPSSGRRGRRSAEQLAQIQERIVALLAKEPKLNSEEIQERLGLTKEDIFRPLQLLRESGGVKTVGEKRSMRYYVGGKRAKATE